MRGSGAAAADPRDAARDTLDLFQTDQHGEQEGVCIGVNHSVCTRGARLIRPETVKFLRRVHGATARAAEADGVFTVAASLAFVYSVLWGSPLFSVGNP
jgi:hypothetical protein